MQRQIIFSLFITLALLASSPLAQELAKKDKTKTVTPAANNPVVGSGAVGRLSKWTGVDGANSFSLGNSNIFEDKFGKVGIGATTPTSLLTVQGMIETTLGGYKFPDGTVQTSAFNASQVVRSLNGLTGDVQLANGANITITQSGNTLTIAAAGALTGVAHDTTLTGNGTPATPLGVAVPLVLTGSVSNPNAIITSRNTNTAQGMGLRGIGGTSVSTFFGVPVGVQGESDSGYGVSGQSNNLSGVIGISSSNTGSDSAGVLGICSGCYGVLGKSTNGVGVRAESNNIALDVESTNFRGVQAVGKIGVWSNTTSSDPNEAAVLGVAAAGAAGAAGIAARFLGNVRIEAFNGPQPGNLAVAGTVSKGAGSFKIDHPLDPQNQYLYHSFVESPDMMNIYNGNITTDENGEATVALPDYFDALNRDFRYQLTVIGTFAQAIVAEKIKGNRFVIKTNAANVEVSWQVTGIRQDAFANKNRIPIEEEKSEAERGFYLHPDAHGQSEERGIQYARDPEGLKQLKARRLEAEQLRKRQPNQR
jgi:hypothetical protein